MPSLIAYDLETTRIEAGTPVPLYITARGENCNVSMPISGENRLDTLRQILETYICVPDNNRAQIIAWNGNRYDVYFIALAFLTSDDWTVRPYLTASKQLRGLEVRHKKKHKGKVLKFQFLDGISMTGLVGTPLKKFLRTYAPELPKLELDLENINFNHRNAVHVEYAERDSEGLYVGLCRVRNILANLIMPKPMGDNSGGETEKDFALKPTIGNLAVRYFMANVPTGIILNRPSEDLKEILHGPVKRGGFCWCVQQYHGKVWKYDINQAYAAAMRDAALPCGTVAYTWDFVEGRAAIYQVEISRSTPSKIPFYYKDSRGGRFTCGAGTARTWITSDEVLHLRADGWNVIIICGYTWDSTFNFADVVNKLETLRRSDPDGPSGALGTMVKAIGNNAYGKTLELLDGCEYTLSTSCPDGWLPLEPMDDDNIIWCRARESYPKEYHLPQLGIFITAHVRCKVRQTALLAPDAFLYCDTDCVVFSRPVDLDIDKVRYGAWKVEAAGERYIIVGKKILWGADGTTKAKGLNTKNLQESDYLSWMEGNAPEQSQLQRQNFLKFLRGSDMFKGQERKGTDVTQSKVYIVTEGRTYEPTENGDTA